MYSIFICCLLFRSNSLIASLLLLFATGITTDVVSQKVICARYFTETTKFGYLEMCLPESDTVENLKKVVVSIEADDSVDFASNVLKKKNLQKCVSKATMNNLHFLRPTSNIAERFFSKSGFEFNDLRQSILPRNLEIQLFLNVNRQFLSHIALWIERVRSTTAFHLH